MSGHEEAMRRPWGGHEEGPGEWWELLTTIWLSLRSGDASSLNYKIGQRKLRYLSISDRAMIWIANHHTVIIKYWTFEFAQSTGTVLTLNTSDARCCKNIQLSLDGFQLTHSTQRPELFADSTSSFTNVLFFHSITSLFNYTPTENLVEECRWEFRVGRFDWLGFKSIWKRFGFCLEVPMPPFSRCLGLCKPFDKYSLVLFAAQFIVILQS